MAKKRFPSPANQGKTPAAKPADGPLPQAVAAKAEKTVQVHYKKENNHILGIGAHALAKGVNTLPASVWSEAQKHPSVAKLLADGHIVDLSKPEAAPAEEEEPAEGEPEAEEDTEESAG
jgi:hypothetical protein